MKQMLRFGIGLIEVSEKSPAPPARPI
jgi:hypothetical protein